ncbi:transposase [Caballeronia sp. EK]|uniref:transposase n=1 Tax=Caballeronia sp. EK TaxID=2767469 RepID=UPI001655643C|nr:transposase [Caballeronia sp. EK]MBC8643002.1 transposase [Caballeronia sp. EK]
MVDERGVKWAEENFQRNSSAKRWRVLEQDYTVTKAAKALGIGEKALRRWTGNRRPVAGAPVNAVEGASAEQVRIRALEKRVMALERERDILKKSTAFFANELDRDAK